MDLEARERALVEWDAPRGLTLKARERKAVFHACMLFQARVAELLRSNAQPTHDVEYAPLCE